MSKQIENVENSAAQVQDGSDASEETSSEDITQTNAHKAVRNSFHFEVKLANGYTIWVPKARVINSQALKDYAKTLTKHEIRK